MGAGLFITTVVLGLVLMVSKSRNYNIGKMIHGNNYSCAQIIFVHADRIDFMRDIIAFMVVLVVIVGVSIDGKVSYFSLKTADYMVTIIIIKSHNFVYYVHAFSHAGVLGRSFPVSANLYWLCCGSAWNHSLQSE